MRMFCWRPPRLGLLTALTLTAAMAVPAGALASSTPAPASGGGAFVPPASQAAPPTGSQSVPSPPGPHARGVWLSRVAISEYWPAPESWFVGALVSAPGLPGKHRVDWLYSAKGVSMNGEGLGLDGQIYHVAQ